MDENSAWEGSPRFCTPLASLNSLARLNLTTLHPVGTLPGELSGVVSDFPSFSSVPATLSTKQSNARAVPLNAHSERAAVNATKSERAMNHLLRERSGR